MMLPVPVALIAAAPPVALNPVPVVVVMFNPPLLKAIVAPGLLVSETAVFAPVFRTLLVPLKVIVPPVLLLQRIPVPLLVNAPDNVTLKFVRFWISIKRPVVLTMGAL